MALRRSGLQEAVDGVYELFPMLAERRAMLAGAMSGGQQQMLAIGQALMAKPALLLLDEPSGGLAPVIVSEVMDRIEELKATGLVIATRPGRSSRRRGCWHGRARCDYAVAAGHGEQGGPKAANAPSPEPATPPDGKPDAEPTSEFTAQRRKARAGQVDPRAVARGRPYGW